MYMPLGWPVLLFASLTTLGFYRLWRHRHPPGHCPKCGYDRAGIGEDAACPECGLREDKNSEKRSE